MIISHYCTTKYQVNGDLCRNLCSSYSQPGQRLLRPNKHGDMAVVLCNWAYMMELPLVHSSFARNKPVNRHLLCTVKTERALFSSALTHQEHLPQDQNMPVRFLPHQHNQSFPPSIHHPSVTLLSCAAVKFSPSQAPSDPSPNNLRQRSKEHRPRQSYCYLCKQRTQR